MKSPKSLLIGIGVIVLVFILFISRDGVKPFEVASFVTSTDGIEHQLSYTLHKTAYDACEPGKGCSLQRMYDIEKNITTSGKFFISYESKIDGSTLCAEKCDIQECNVDSCDKSVVVTMTNYGSFKMQPGEFVQLTPNINITYAPVFGYVTVGKGERYIADVTYNFLVGINVANMVSIKSSSDNSLIIPFREEGTQSFDYLASEDAYGMKGLIVGQDVSDVMQLGSLPIYNPTSLLEGTQSFDISIPTQELGTRTLDVYPAIMFTVGGQEPRAINLQSYLGKRHIYDVLPKGADSSKSRARSYNIILSEGASRILSSDNKIIESPNKLQVVSKEKAVATVGGAFEPSNWSTVLIGLASIGVLIYLLYRR